MGVVIFNSVQVRERSETFRKSRKNSLCSVAGKRHSYDVDGQPSVG
jgi:hypothetical protein